MATAVQQLQDYLEAFSLFESRAAGGHLSWLRALRREAFSSFYERGFPTTHDEDWRFTNVAPIERTPFRLSQADAHVVNSRDLVLWHIEGIACRLVLVNGHFARSLSVLNSVPAKIVVGGLAEQLTNSPESVEPHLGRYLDQQRDSFSALNTAFAEDGAFIHIPKGVALDSPIHLLFVSTASSAPEMNHPRTLVVIEEGSRAAIVEDFVSVGSGTTFCNAATEVVAAEDSNVSHYLIEREHSDAFNISTLRIQQARSVNIDTHSLIMGGALVRNNVHPVLAGEGGECLINGLFLGTDRQHLDNYMLVEHAAPHCSSRQFYNGILGQHARGVFHGRIIVHKAAQGTDAKQTNRNLLLSDDAQIDTKPQLEIYADDVKCTHGATIGKIEEEALFYLRARGIDEAAARKLLLVAFASECLGRMNEGPVRTYIEDLVTNYVQRIAS